MRLISRHILRTMAVPFSWGVVALTGMLLLNALPPLIDAFGGKGIPVRTMIEGVLLFIPALIALTLPMSVLVAVMYGYTQLASALELVAMYANGISVWRMARPALIAAAVIAVINFMVFDQLMPHSNARFGVLRLAVLNKTPTLALRPQVLNKIPGGQGYSIRADAIDQETGKMRGVTILDLGTEYGTRRLIAADSGLMAYSPDGMDLILTLHNGQIDEFKREEPTQLQHTVFLHNRVRISNVQNQLDPNYSRRPGMHQSTELSSCELLDDIARQRFTATQARSTSEYLTRRDLRQLASLPQPLQPAEQTQPAMKPHCGVYRKVGDWFKHLIIPGKLAAQVPAQQPPATPPATPGAQTPQQTPAPPPAVVQAAPQQGFLVPTPQQQGPALLSDVNTVRVSAMGDAQARTTVLRYQIEFHQKIAIPLSCFCFVLLGMSLALKFPNGGIGLVIGGSLVIFLGFYILLQGGKGVALSGRVDPVITMYAPLVLFTLIGLITLNAADREMGTARSASILDRVRNLYHRLRH